MVFLRIAYLIFYYGTTLLFLGVNLRERVEERGRIPSGKKRENRTDFYGYR